QNGIMSKPDLVQFFQRNPHTLFAKADHHPVVGLEFQYSDKKFLSAGIAQPQNGRPVQMQQTSPVTLAMHAPQSRHLSIVTYRNLADVIIVDSPAAQHGTIGSVLSPF